MRRFAELFHAVDATTSTSDKVALLAAYFQGVPSDDAAWALALLTGNRPKGAATTGVLRQLAIETTEIPEWLLAECHAAVGDLSETIALLLPEPDATEPESLAATMAERVLPLRTSNEDQKRSIIRAAWAAFRGDERIVYHKLIRGGFRLGIQKRLVARALAEATGLEHDTVLHRLTGGFDPTSEAFDAIVSREDQRDRMVQGYPFYLAHPLAAGGADEVGERLGNRTDWIAERKWDGIRAQLVWRAGISTLWSRGEGLISEQFPELLAAASYLPDGTVLDGEVLLWRHGSPLPFAALQRRLNRKVAPTHQLKLFDETRAVMIAYDLLEQAGEDLRQHPLFDRRARLEAMVNRFDTDHTFRLSEMVDAKDWAGLESERAKSRDLGVEGLMLKHRRAPYGVGRTKADEGLGWYKWKVDPYTAEAVLIGANPGSGRRANLYTDYTFAVWDGDESNPDRALVTFAKAYSGLTQDEIERLDAWIRSHTTTKRGPFRSVQPSQVFELAFEGIQASDRHKSGLAVRFPRIARWRTDKPAAEADTLATLQALLGSDA